jgi:hypothetical protein
MSLSYFHERDLGRLGIPADIEWVGTDRLSVHLSPDSLDRLVEHYTDEEAVEQANEEGYAAGQMDTEVLWDKRLDDLERAWRNGTPDDLLDRMAHLARELGWGESGSLDELRYALDPDDD